jgi:hypothetical protein
MCAMQMYGLKPVPFKLKPVPFKFYGAEWARNWRSRKSAPAE